MTNFFQQHDKHLHMLTCFGLLLAFQLVMPLACAIQLVILIGIGKEIYDSYHPDIHTCDVFDIVADTIGCYAGVVLVLAYQHI